MFPFLAQSQPTDVNRFVDTIARTPLSRIVFLVLILSVVRALIAPYIGSTPVHQRGFAFGLARFVNETLDAIIYAAVFVFLIIRPFGIQMFVIPTESMIDTLKVSDYIVANKAVYRYSDPVVGDIVVFRPPKGAVQKKSFLDADGQVNQDYVKRCVGVPGDIVETKNGVLYRNGRRIDEPYLKDPQIDGCFKLVHYMGDYAPFKGHYIPVSSEDTDFGPSTMPNYGQHSTRVSPDFAVGLARTYEEDGDIRMEFKMDSELTPEERNTINELRDAPPAAIPPGYYLMMGDNRNGSYDGRYWGLIPKSAVIGRSEAIMWPASRWRRTR